MPNSSRQPRRLPSVSRMRRLIELTAEPETLHSRGRKKPLGRSTGREDFCSGDPELTGEFTEAEEVATLWFSMPFCLSKLGASLARF